MKKNKIRLLIRKYLRIVVKARENETISDAFVRKKKNLYIKFNQKTFSIDELDCILEYMGLQEGDYIFLHCSLKSFFQFENMNSEILINKILSKIGESGVLMMPGSGDNQNFLDVLYTPSSFGKITEVFRSNYPIKRSLNSYFSVSYLNGKDSCYKDNHIKSRYPFDEKSPFNDLLVNDGKILCLGIGKHPHKITFIHYVVYRLLKDNKNFEKIIGKELNTTLVLEDRSKIEKNIIVRADGLKNDKRNISKLAKNTHHKYLKKGKLDCYCCNAVDIFDTAKQMMNSNIKFYKI
ncbi:hypothetical protein EsVE80_05300 [Enterococcus saigonensis]|uniref:Aminoglycoside N(3)-acetyltransferase n=1 Tax=Enterococcus saigonensis TaxID=1805431 RepID=A0A679IPP9_9ENTE|nr:AAC(3) family N-acetyltransferase [Enterococcus saigonensis]BCA85007.1 hypothetical protein EsVE80_05300 [Enterococcus saigonensis]